MNKYKGTLSRLGESVTTVARLGTATITNYSVIEIGGVIIHKVRTGSYLSSFLDLGDDIEIYVQRFGFFNHLMAIKTESGTVYRTRSFSQWFWMVVHVALATLVLVAVLFGGLNYLQPYLSDTLYKLSADALVLVILMFVGVRPFLSFVQMFFIKSSFFDLFGKVVVGCLIAFIVLTLSINLGSKKYKSLQSYGNYSEFEGLLNDPNYTPDILVKRGFPKVKAKFVNACRAEVFNRTKHLFTGDQKKRQQASDLRKKELVKCINES